MRARVGNVAVAADAMAGDRPWREAAGEHAFANSVIDLDVEAMVVALIAVYADTVVQRVVLRASHGDVGHREVLHHLVRDGIDEIAGAVRKLIGSSDEQLVAR